ncbi:MAG: sulfatase-like hydrolase/transferase [Prolixibacteraceae bacterium]|nr:sulfatase-like hydrolase/transferase [Prolixibacteraceae bacterium]
MLKIRLNKKKYEANEYLVLLYRFTLLMVFYSICRILFYLFNTASFPKVTFWSFFTILKGGLMFDVSALIYLNAIYMLLFLLPFQFKFNDWYQKLLKWIFILSNAIGIAFNLMDIIYYRYILKRTTASMFDVAAFDAGNTNLLMRFVYDFWYILLILSILLILLSVSYSILKPKPFPFRHPFAYFLSGIPIIALVVALSVIGVRGGWRHSTRPISMNNAGAFVNAPEEMSIVQNTPFCIMRTWGKKAFVHKTYFASEEELNRIYSPVHVPDSLGMARKDNVVFIILESFSRAFVGSLNPQFKDPLDRSYTPFLDSLISQSLVFTNAFANGRKSIDAIPSVTASIPALVLPYVISERSGNTINSMASLLGNQGYESAFYHGAPNGSMGFDAFTKIAGFQHYYGRTEYNNEADFDGIWGVWDEPFFQYFAHGMSSMKEPFFTTIFSISSHHPYELPAKYKGKFPEGRLPINKCIRYTDHSLQKFFDTARKMPWFKNTLFVITADHTVDSDIPEYYTSVNHFAIPILFYKPDGSLKGVDHGLAQQIDIMPTVLSYLAYPNPYVAFGNNLLDPAAKRFVINYIEDSYQFLSGDYAFYLTDDKLTAIYNRKEDPSLSKNLLGTVDLIQEQQLQKAIVQQFNNRMAENRMVVERK